MGDGASMFRDQEEIERILNTDCDAISPNDALFDASFIEDMKGTRGSQLSRAGVDDDTDACTFMEMNGRNVFVTEV